MINWTTDEECRRCRQWLGRSSDANGAAGASNRFYLYSFIFIAALALPVLVSFADPALGDNLGMFFVVGAIGLIMSVKFLLIYEMFKVSVMWGAAGIIFAPVSTLLFVANYWEQAKGKLFMLLAAIIYIVIMIAAVGHLTKPKVAQNTVAPQTTPAPMNDYLNQTPTPKPDLTPRKDLLKKK
jgi:hypothetical protein